MKPVPLTIVQELEFLEEAASLTTRYRAKIVHQFPFPTPCLQFSVQPRFSFPVLFSITHTRDIIPVLLRCHRHHEFSDM